MPHSRRSVTIEWDERSPFFPGGARDSETNIGGRPTHSLKRRLWILVMAFEAMGLPMPELAGEPWETGVMLYGEFWLAGDREASLGTLRPFSGDRRENNKV